MTELNPVAPVRKLNLARIPQVLLQPRRTFAEIAGEASSSWLTPLLTLSLSSLVSVFVSGYLTSRAAQLGNVPLPPDWQYWTPDMQNNYLQAQQATQGSTFVYIIPLVLALVGLWLGWLILSGLLHLGSTLLGGRGSMQGALNIVGWGNLPFMARDVLRVIFMLLAGHAIVSPGLSGFAGSSAFVSQILSRVDVFFIWNAILLIVGFSAADGLSKNKATIGVVIVLTILMLVLAGFGALGSSLSGLSL